MTTTFSVDEGIVTFTWTYDDSVNQVPATSFLVTIIPVMGGTNPISKELPPDQLSYTLPLSRLMKAVRYNVSVTVRNMQGASIPTFDPFTTPGTDARYSVEGIKEEEECFTAVGNLVQYACAYTCTQHGGPVSYYTCIVECG